MFKVSVTALRQQADYHRRVYHVVVPNDTLLSDLLRPGAWVHHADALKPGALVDVIREDMSLDVQLRVLASQRGLVDMRARMVYNDRATEGELLAARSKGDEPEAEEVLPEVPEGYKVYFAPKIRWAVQLKDTTQVIFKDLPSKSEAIRKAIEHQRHAVGEDRVAA